jgi:hypothetical protein
MTYDPMRQAARIPAGTEGSRTELAMLNRKFYDRCPTPKLFFCHPGQVG